MAAPDRIDRVPMSTASKPKVARPPFMVQVDRMNIRREEAVICDRAETRNVAFMDVLGPASGTRR